MTLAVVVGQVGCLTLVIIAIALIAGLWLDARFDTKPLITLGLVIASVPLTLFLMFRVVLTVAPKIQINAQNATVAPHEEKAEGGKERTENQET
jgi:MFS-type transporter involved in bile tolerance (Atg22 family)